MSHIRYSHKLSPGTFLFLFFAFGGTQAAKINWDPTMKSHDPTLAPATQDLLLYVAFAFGFSLTVNVWIFYRVSGGLFNPAITLGCVVIGAMSPMKGGLLAVSQLLGGIAASGMVQALVPGELAVGTGLARRFSLDEVTCLGSWGCTDSKHAAGVSTAQGLFLEMFLTALLMISIFFVRLPQSCFIGCEPR